MAKFVISKSRIVKNWPCIIPVPMSGGEIRPHRIGLDFNLPTKSEYAGAVKTAIESNRYHGDDDNPGGDDLMTPEVTVMSFIKSRIEGWSGVVMDEGDTEDEPFAQAALDAFADIPYVRMAIQKSFNSAMDGAKEKN